MGFKGRRTVLAPGAAASVGAAGRGGARGMRLHNRSPRPAFSRAAEPRGARVGVRDGARAGATGPPPPPRGEEREEPREEGAKGGGGGEGQWV